MESTTRYGKHCKTNRKSLPWCALANSTSTATVKNSSSSPEKQNRKCSSTTPSANSYLPAPKARNNHKQTASGDGELWTCKQGKAEKHIFGFIPLVVPRKGFSPHIPASRLFILFHPSTPPPFHQIKQPLSKIAINERAVPTNRKKVGEKCGYFANNS